MRLVFGFALALAAAIGGATSPALASFSPVNAPFFTNEDGRNKILGAQYGGTFTATGPSNINYTNGTVTAVRVEDIFANPAPVALALNDNGSVDDQLWQANFKLASAEAIFGAFNQEFGYFDGPVGGSY